MYDAKLRTAELAREVWRDRPLAERLEREAEELKRNFNARFWTDARGGYYVLALDGEKGREAVGSSVDVRTRSFATYGLGLLAHRQSNIAVKRVAFDAMAHRPVVGTRDWRRYDVVLDVPVQAASLAFGAHLAAAGTIWVDDVKLEIVDASVPVTGSSASPPRNLDFED